MEKKKSINPSHEEGEDGPIKKLRITGTSINTQPKRKIETCCSCSPLPFDIVAEILSRLPAKSLAKFRCVCKQWLSLTYDPRFVKSQHERSSSYFIIFNDNVFDGKISLYDFGIGDGRKPTETSYKLDLGRRYYKLSNFVDGLACAYGTPSSNIYLLNPMTRELQKLPGSVRRKGWHFNERFGLGVDMTMGQYKIVRLFSPPEDREGRVHCQIYTLGTARWRSLGVAPFEFNHRYSPVLLHGAFHWIGDVASGDHQEAKRCVVKFNIKDEKFEPMICIPIPSVSPEDSVCLKEFGAKLRLVVWSPFIKSFEIWTFKDYMKNTWVKEYKFQSSSLPSLPENFHGAEVVNGEVLIKFHEGGKWHVMCYCPRTGAFCKCAGQEHFAIYRESLISPGKISQRRTKKGGRQ